MSIATYIAIYFILWWLVLFAVLPVGLQRDRQPIPGQDPGAPAKPDFRRIIRRTTVVSAVLMLVAVIGVETGLLDYRAIVGSQ